MKTNNPKLYPIWKATTLLIVMLLCCGFGVHSQTPLQHYHDWAIQSSYLDAGDLLITNNGTKQIKFDVGISRFLDQNAEFKSVNFQFHLRRLAAGQTGWCSSSEIISSNFSIKTSDFGDNDNYVTKEFSVTVSAGTSIGKLRNGDRILLYVQDATYGSDCSGWFPVDEEQVVVYLEQPSIPTNVFISRTDNGANIGVTWANHGRNIDAGQMRLRSLGGSWGSPSNEEVSSGSAYIGTGAKEVQVRSHNAAGWSIWSSVQTINALVLSAPSDVEIFNPYYYNLRWTDPNEAVLSGRIEVQTGGYWGDPNSYYTVATIDDFHATSFHIGSQLPTSKYRLKFVDSFGRIKYSNIVDPEFKSASDLEIFKPYYYNLRWTDPNETVLSGRIEVQEGGYWGDPNSYYTVATIDDFHATSFYIGSQLPTSKYRLKFVSSSGQVKYSNVAEETQLKQVTTLEIFKPYYYNLRWIDPNSSLLSGRIEVQEGGYWGDPNSYYTVATIDDFHATTFYIGSQLPTSKYRLKITDQVGRVVYSNIVEYDVSARNITQEIKDLEASKVTIYPSPANDKIYITSISEGTGYRIMGLDGRVDLDGVVDFTNENVDCEIDINRLTKGVYILNFEGYLPQKFLVE
ncbi:T9SS type A sorting domain-containing protein [Reichenbachiella agariperforans]|uniref:T9SS type A sorting domain-containing protein n=1 Tax=Reichenbachiella agariperforans TaxID=156994 RepID=UPI001C09F223|nr:T9SS type A sorting domain-containing protein [Reichenbachiella agariperforans]MBU2914173.1 T9SS type A sorting domain-containing protein [Reichenbachiella agariperforans]